jgi:hypothetical protein
MVRHAEQHCPHPIPEPELLAKRRAGITCHRCIILMRETATRGIIRLRLPDSQIPLLDFE